MKKTLISLAVLNAITGNAYAADFGQKVEHLLNAQSVKLFGVVKPLNDSSSASISADEANADPSKLMTVAKGLRIKVISAKADLGPNIDQMALWPDNINPTHIIACNEQSTGQVALQRIDIATGEDENIISSGLKSCDPVRITAWGTIVFGEEAGTHGRVFEVIDPLHISNVIVSGSDGATTTSSANVAFRPALGLVSFEGLAMYPNGVTYYGDENRPGSGNPGGAYYKFIPDTPWYGASAISDLSQSPLVSGSIYGMRVGVHGSGPDYGQGNEFGRGMWIPVAGDTPVNLRAAASDLKLTAYYRPEDMDIDPAALKAGNVRFCGNNTGEDTQTGDHHWGETMCITDGTLDEATDNTATPDYQLLIMGNEDFAMMDNIAYQPGTGNWVINEDGEGPVANPPRNNDIWSCLDDGADKDILSDGCIKVATLNDLNAETTGGIFDATGSRYFVSVQHNVTGHGVILEINGWKKGERDDH